MRIKPWVFSLRSYVKSVDNEVDSVYYSSRTSFGARPDPCLNNQQQKVTLTRYLSGIAQENPDLREMESLLLSIQMACKTISNMINRAGINNISSCTPEPTSVPVDFRSRSMQRLDQISTNVLKNALRFTGKLTTIARTGDEAAAEDDADYKPKEHQPGVLVATALDSKYIAFFDPLDGSGNADAAIPTGTIFGIFRKPEEMDEGDMEEEELIRNVLQPGSNLQAAGYCLYSSATILIFSIKSVSGGKVNGFTLDPQLGDFVLTHSNLQIPHRGNVYSCNESNSLGWDPSLLAYCTKLKSGQNQSQQKYALRYIGTMVGDIHRTIFYGGIFWYPQDTVGHPNGNLQLLYKVMPLGYLLVMAGGKATNGKTHLMDVTPEHVHQRSPCFMGSPNDMDEMMNYVKHYT